MMVFDEDYLMYFIGSDVYGVLKIVMSYFRDI